jgi:hypothetical protein
MARFTTIGRRKPDIILVMFGIGLEMRMTQN